MTYPDHDDTPTSRTGRFRGSEGYKSSTLILSLLVLVLLIGGAVYVGFRGGNDTSSNTAAVPGAPSVSGPVPAQTSPPSTVPPEAFGIPSTDTHGTRIDTPINPVGQVLPQTRTGTPPVDDSPNAPVPAPAGLMWQRVAGIALPFSTSDGPTAITGAGVPTGFAHTRQGAAIAAWQIAYRTGVVSNAQTRAIIDTSAVLNPDGTSQPVVDGMTNKPDDFAATLRQMPAATFNAPIAARVDNYDGTYAHVQFALPLEPGRTDAFIATAIYADMVWRDNTWKWVVPADGVEPGQLTTTLDGFTPWAPAS